MTIVPSDPQPPRPAAPVRRCTLADELRRLGPVHRRIGHYLATRPDVLGAADREALFDLGDRVGQLPWPAVRHTLQDALGAELSELFAEVDPTARWATAIHQLHCGRLPDGTPVAVKVVRPGARHDVAAALRELPERLPALLALADPAPVGDLGDIVEDVVDWLARQTDLTAEATVLDRLLPVRALRQWEHIPVTEPDLCGATVLVCEDAGGVAVSEVAHAPGQLLDELELDPTSLARAIVTLTVRQAFRYRRFQTDLHPDNVVALPGGAVSYADWSSFGELDPALADDELTYLTAVFDGDTERSLDPPTDLVVFDDEGDVAAFRRDLLRDLRDRALSESGRRPEAAPAELLAEVMRAGREHRIGLPVAARLLYGALATAHATAQRLDPAVDTRDVGRRALQGTRVGSKIRTLAADRLEATAYDAAALLRDSPGQLQKILSELADGTFSLNVWVAEVAQAERNRNRRTRVLVAAIVSISLAALLTAQLPRAGGVSLAWPVAIALLAVYGWLLHAWRGLR